MQGDTQLIRRIKRGSRRAADELFARHYLEIYSYIFRQCGERELSMDLAQETFVAAFRGARGYDEKKASFRTWLFHIASNKVTDHYRSRAHRARTLERSFNELPFELSDDSDIVKRLEERSLISEIMQLVSEHELSWVRIFQKKCFEEKTFSQIASELKLSEGTVKTRYYAMIKRIRRELCE